MVARLHLIMNYYELNASAFAEKLGIQPSGISHILSQRNKPSLDFIIKLVEKFPEVDINWFVFGSGQFPKEEKKSKLSNTSNNEFVINNNSFTTFGEDIENKMQFSPNEINSNEKKIKKIVFFYTDNSFEVFLNND